MKFVFIRFDLQAKERVLLGEYPGAKIRGAILEGLKKYCPLAGISAVDETHVKGCPICKVTAKRAFDRGDSAPKAFSIQYHGTPVVKPNEMFSFTVSVVGDYNKFLFYLISAVSNFEFGGIGVGRNTATLLKINSYSIIDDKWNSIFENGNSIADPIENDTQEINLHYSQEKIPDGFIIQFLSPTRIVAGGAVEQIVSPRNFVSRLADRLNTLNSIYGDGKEVVNKQSLIHQTEVGKTTILRQDFYNQNSYNHYEQRKTPVSGVTGAIRFYNLRNPKSGLYPALIMGQYLGVGKLTTKGDGHFAVIPEN